MDFDVEYWILDSWKLLLTLLPPVKELFSGGVLFVCFLLVLSVYTNFHCVFPFESVSVSSADTRPRFPHPPAHL